MEDLVEAKMNWASSEAEGDELYMQVEKQNT
jgi:hypothetical protein